MDIKTKRHSLGSSLKIAINKEAFPGIPLYVADDTKKESKKTLIIRPFKGLVKDEETDKPTSLSTKEHKKEKKDRAISPSIKRTGSVDKKKEEEINSAFPGIPLKIVPEANSMENKKTEKDTPKFTAPSMMEAKVSNDQ